MPKVSAEQLAHQIHSRTTRFVIAVTGGGSAAISSLLGVPGASRSILAATVPYSTEATIEWLGGKPGEFCSSWTARAMAMTAYLRTRKYDPQGETCGVACTASLASDRPKRGPHRAYLAFQTATTTVEWSIQLAKGGRSRAEEEVLVATLIQNLVAEACGILDRIAAPLLAGEQVQERRRTAPHDEQDLLAGATESIARGAARTTDAPQAILSGAFHPLHEGHRGMAQIAARILGTQVAFELSIVNVDKPTLDFLEIDERVRQFSRDEAVWLSRASTFVEKVALFPGATFVVGADTMARIGEPRYYGDERARDAAIEQIRSLGCRFLVFARSIDGDVCALADLPLPDGLADICQEVPQSEFRNDISSTQLRQAGAG